MVFTSRMCIFQIFVITSLVVSVIAQDPDAEQSQLEDVKLKLEEFGPCEGQEDLPLRYHDVSLEMVGRNEVAIAGQYTADVVVGSNKDYKVEVHLTKCDSKQQVDSCQHFLTHEVDMCEHLAEENKVWSALVNYTKNFIPDCPLETGTFVVDKAPVNFGDLEKLPFCVGYWKIDVFGTDDGEPVFCTHAEIQISAKRRKNKE